MTDEEILAVWVRASGLKDAQCEEVLSFAHALLAARANLASGQSAENRGEDHGFESIWNRARVMDETPKTVAKFIWCSARNALSNLPQAFADDVLTLRQLEAGMRSIADSIGPICASKMNAAIAAERAADEGGDRERS